jgi:hemolysin activation/secretion protein
MIEEELPYTLEFGFDNYETPTVGAYGGSLHAADRNLLGRGDRLGSDLSVTEGLVRVGGLYELPINSFGTSVFAEARYSHAELTENPFNKLDVKNNSYTFSLGVTQTVIHTPRDKVDLTLRAERRWSRSELLGRSFSFSDGSQNGRSEIFVLRAISEWSRREASTVMSARSTFSWGLDLLSPTVNSGSAPDGIFFSWLGQARFLHRFDPTGIEISFRGDIQLSDRPLLPLEQFTIGGAGNVRGYRKNQIVHDQGLIGSVDLRFPLWRTDTGRTILSIAPFADLGRTWNRDRVTHGKRTLSSLGAGLRYRPVPDWTFEVEWGGALRNTDTSGDLQDDGVIFRTTWRAL